MFLNKRKTKGRFVAPALKAVLLPAALVGMLGSTSTQAYTSKDGSLEVNGFIENASHYRRGGYFSKIRNTAQLEFSKKFKSSGRFSGIGLYGTFRATYDAVYDVEDGKFGKNAGGPVALQSIGGSGFTPYGASDITTGAPPVFPWGPGGFGFNTTTNPNAGLEVLGSDLHGPDGGVTLGVPVRPCDVDPRGCISGYMDADTDELRHPEFNDRLDFIRELYMTFKVNQDDGTDWGFSIGKQQVVWGRTDLFRVLDVINPVDYARHNIFDELEDIRIPMWTVVAEKHFGATEKFDDLNLQFVWVFDKFRPNNLGQGGTPYAILDAGNFFRGMNNCWHNGCSVSNFAGGAISTDFPKHTIGIRKAHMPKWALDNTQFGVKLEGEYKGVGFSFNALTYRSQLPSLRGGIPARNPFLADGLVFPNVDGPGPIVGETGGDEIPRDYLIAFDIHFPRVHMIGGSLDLYADSIKSVFRVEASYTTGEEFANSLKPRLFSESDVFRFVIGWDRPTFIKALNPRRAFLLSAQLFGQYLLDHERMTVNGIDVGMPDHEFNAIGTFLIKGWFKNDRVSPQLIIAHDFGAKATVFSPSVDWLISDKLRLVVSANIKVGDTTKDFDDCRACNPFPGFTDGGAGLPPGALAMRNLAGLEPLGRFQAGPLGMAQNEDEVQVTLRYRF